MKAKQILTGLVSLAVAAAVVGGVRFGLSGLRSSITQAEQQEMIRFMLPESTTFTPEEYTGEDETIAAVYKGETGYVVETYQVWYKNGEEVSRNLLCTSTYKAYQKTVEYNE